MRRRPPQHPRHRGPLARDSGLEQQRWRCRLRDPYRPYSACKTAAFAGCRCSAHRSARAARRSEVSIRREQYWPTGLGARGVGVVAFRCAELRKLGRRWPRRTCANRQALLTPGVVRSMVFAQPMATEANAMPDSAHGQDATGVAGLHAGRSSQRGVGLDSLTRARQTGCEALRCPRSRVPPRRRQRAVCRVPSGNREAPCRSPAPLPERWSRCGSRGR